jgi:CRP/FNR family nitrogen fixation transcriptional regulator
MSFSGNAALTSNPGRFSPAAAHPLATKTANNADLSELDRLGTVCRFRRGETIFGEGDELQSSYKIVSGAVRLSRITEDGRRQIVEFRVAGDLMGFEWAGSYGLSAEAVRDVTAIRYMRPRIDRVIQEKPEVRDQVLALVRKELQAAHDHLITLGRQGAKERVATFLLQLARRAGAGDGQTIEIELGRQDIADYLGLTLETISRTLSEFQRIGAIGLPKRRQILIRSKAKLRAQMVCLN